MQEINEECVVLKEVIRLQTASVTDPKIRKKFSVVGCKDSMDITHTHTHTQQTRTPPGRFNVDLHN